MKITPILKAQCALALLFIIGTVSNVAFSQTVEFEMPHCQNFNWAADGTSSFSETGYTVSFSDQYDDFVSSDYATLDKSPLIRIHNHSYFNEYLPPYHLTSPSILVSGNDPEVSWNEALESYTNNSVSKNSPLKLWVSEDGGEFVLIESLTADELPNHSLVWSWRVRRISLSKYIGHSIRFRWEIESIDDEDLVWYIDDICFEDKVNEPELPEGKNIVIEQAGMPFREAGYGVIIVHRGAGELILNSWDFIGDDAFIMAAPYGFPHHIVGLKSLDDKALFEPLHFPFSFVPENTGLVTGSLNIDTNLGEIHYSISGFGLACDIAEEAAIGTNISPSQNKVYTYTAPPDQDQLVQISTCLPSNNDLTIDTHLFVARSCGTGGLIVENLNMGVGACEYSEKASEATVVVRAGNTIYLFWPKRNEFTDPDQSFFFTVQAVDYNLRDVYVDNTSISTEELGTMENPYHSLQLAMDNLRTFDNVHISGGIYYGNFQVVNEGIAIYGSYNPDNWEVDFENYPTILDGMNQDPVLEILNSEATISNLIFQHGIFWRTNGPPSSGGVTANYSKLVMKHCIVRDNGGTDKYGCAGMRLDGSDAYILGCEFYNNTVDNGVAVIDCEGGSKMILENSLILQNSNEMAIHVLRSGGKVINNTFIDVNNSGTVLLWMYECPSMLVENNILVGGNLLNFGIPEGVVNYNMSPNPVNGVGNIVDFPVFSDPSNNNFKLLACSPGVDAGNPNKEANDLDGTRNDMGYFGGPQGLLYEHAECLSKSIYVNNSSTSQEEDGSIEHPFKSLNLALENSRPIDEIWVAGGTYNGNWEIADQDINIFGSFNPDSWIQDYENFPTILDGGGSGNVLRLSRCSGQIDGIIIENGTGETNDGAGARFSQCELVVKNSIFRNNHNSGGTEQQWAAGGVLIYSGNISFIGCQFYENSSLGGAASFRGGNTNVTIENCLFYGESGINTIHFNNSTGIINNTTVYCNSSTQNGIIRFNESPLVVSNTIVQGENIGFRSEEVNMSYSLTSSIINGEGNISNHARLIDPMNGNFELMVCSPAINSGNPDSNYNDIDGSRNDLGYYGGPKGKLHEYGDCLLKQFNMPYYQDVNSLATGTNPLFDYGWESSFPANLSVYVANAWTTIDNSNAFYLRNREIIDDQRTTIFLKSPGIEVTGTEPVITWNEVAYSAYNQSGAKESPRNLFISTDGRNFIPVDSYLTSEMPDAAQGECWRTKEYPLSEYLGQTIWWKWESESINNEYTYWVIDNICFEEKNNDPHISNINDLEIIWPVLPYYPANRNLYLKNDGGGEVEITSVEIIGDDVFNWLNPIALPFTISGLKVASEALCNLSFRINVQFAPLESKNYSATIRVETSEGVLEFPISGQGRHCDHAEIAYLGENWSPTQNTIYSYTASYDELVTVTSCDPRNTVDPYQYSYDSFLGIFSSCDLDSKIAENDDLESEGCEFNRASSGATVLVKAGQTIYITWPFMYHNPAHAWDGFYFNLQSIPATIPIDIGLDQTAYIGYEPSSCVTIDPNIQGGIPPFTYLWSNGETTETITVCPDEFKSTYFSLEFSLLITDSRGEIGIAYTTVNIEDVRCGKKNDKVLLCVNDKNPHTICVSPNAVPAHLRKGATLGSCKGKSGIFFDDEEIKEFGYQVYPNPSAGIINLDITMVQDDKLEIYVTDLIGRTVHQESVYLGSGNNYRQVDLSMLSQGLYVVELRAGSDRLTQMISIQ